MGMPPARWLRIAALARRLPPPPVPAINRAIYSELARMGVNLNQLARAANEGRLDGLPPVLLIWRQTVSPHSTACCLGTTS